MSTFWKNRILLSFFCLLYSLLFLSTIIHVMIRMRQNNFLFISFSFQENHTHSHTHRTGTLVYGHWDLILSKLLFLIRQQFQMRGKCENSELYFSVFIGKTSTIVSFSSRKSFQKKYIQIFIRYFHFSNACAFEF